MNGYRVEMENSISKYTVVITKHAKERFAQRFANNSTEDQTSNILSVFSRSKETSGFLNNHRLLQYFYDTYGYKRKFFYIYRNTILFVCEKKGNLIYILTCMKSPLWAIKPKKYRSKNKLVVQH
ncbi:MAG: hypothetical protein WC325_13095 [Candidatus Bathyarchaeia archaeon]